MDLLIYRDLAIMVFAAIGFISGASEYLRPHRPLYASMIVLGTGCIALGRAYTFMRVLTGLPVNGVFHAGILGTVGAFAFFFSSNYGQIDSLVDDGGDDFIKYRASALLGVAAAAAIYIWILYSPVPRAEKISDGIAAAAIALASYFHLKHIFIPDVDYGVVSCLRGFNVLALIYGMLCMLEMAVSAYGYRLPLAVICVFQCIVAVLLVPVMKKGVHEWSR